MGTIPYRERSAGPHALRLPRRHPGRGLPPGRVPRRRESGPERVRAQPALRGRGGAGRPAGPGGGLPGDAPPVAAGGGPHRFRATPSSWCHRGETGFRIEESLPDAFRFPPIPPDLALCARCAAELLDPGDRRYLYPFITCTQCGPRYSIVERTPFDRETTSMADFRQCPECLREYARPGGPTLPLPDQLLPGLRPAPDPERRGRPSAPGRPPDSGRGGPGGGPGRGPAGHRRFPPGRRPARRRGGAAPAPGQGARTQALRPDGRGPRGNPRPVPSGGWRRGGAGLPRRPDPDPARARPGRPGTWRGLQHRHSRGHAALHSPAPAAVPPPAGAGRLPAPDHDLRQPEGRTDPDRPRGGPGEAGGGRGPVPDARPQDRVPHRRLGAAPGARPHPGAPAPLPRLRARAGHAARPGVPRHPGPGRGPEERPGPGAGDRRVPGAVHRRPGGPAHGR